jgi:branched-chain amino acid transport system ATP-binding protein
MLLSVENLAVSYDEIKALHGIDFEVNEGEIVCIIGANGAGKSTTLRAISRLIPSEAGTKLFFEGIDLLSYPADKVVSELGISHVPEGRRLFDNLTVMENLKLATFARKDGDEIERDYDRVFSIFPRLKERINQKAGTLSGGEQQMLAVGRALMSGRRLMLLDEPSMGLAPMLMLNVFDALKEINQEGTTILVVEQNARMALQFAQRGYVLESGNLVLEGPSAELLENPDVKKAYLGG